MQRGAAVLIHGMTAANLKMQRAFPAAPASHSAVSWSIPVRPGEIGRPRLRPEASDNQGGSMQVRLGVLLMALASAMAVAAPDVHEVARGFQVNKGQYERPVRYAWHGPSYTLLLADSYADLVPVAAGECSRLRIRWPGSK